MRQVPGYSLWLGNAGDVRDVQGVLSAGIVAIVDLALEEPPAPVTRELVYCRFPLVDGPGNPPPFLRVAIETVVTLLRSNCATLVSCGAGMSRSPAIAAAAIALVRGSSPSEALAAVAEYHSADVSPGLWRDVELMLK